jgi:hypothetical protein
MARSKSAGSVTIASGASLSGAINLGDKVLSAIIMPASWTAAALTFQASDDGGTTWKDMYDDGGNEISILSANAVAGRRISVDPSAFAGIDLIKVRSGTSGSATAQGADRVITLVSRKYYALD